MNIKIGRQNSKTKLKMRKINYNILRRMGINLIVFCNARITSSLRSKSHQHIINFNTKYINYYSLKSILFEIKFTSIFIKLKLKIKNS